MTVFGDRDGVGSWVRRLVLFLSYWAIDYESEFNASIKGN